VRDVIFRAASPRFILPQYEIFIISQTTYKGQVELASQDLYLAGDTTPTVLAASTKPLFAIDKRQAEYYAYIYRVNASPMPLS
jgi:hypothetical protein